MPKFWLDSQTIRGGLMTAIPTVTFLFKMFGVEIENDFADAFLNAFMALTNALGLAWVFIGRAKAGDGIRWTK